tara:strand:+ start:204 stop:410 length:207 start_codon:yes stop_codon:yes gene_type:complete
MDVYVVVGCKGYMGGEVYGVSAKLQGAESIRSDAAKRLATVNLPDDPDGYRYFYDRMTIVNVELMDLD